MTSIDDNEARRLLEQLQGEQTQAGLDHIAQCAREFFDAFLKAGFRRKEAFKLTQSMLGGWLEAGIAAEADDEEDES